MNTKMASRPIVPQQAAAVEAKKNPARDGKNRRALGDIGNLANVKGADKAKPDPQINRPLTRSFCAQLAKIENNNKAPVLAVAAPPQRAQKKPTSKPPPPPPKPTEVIEISPDTNERSPKTKAKNKTRTLTSTLTARSKAACGITNKPKDDVVVDIDSADANNHLAGVEYVDDIYNFYKSAENENRPHDYMEMQVDLNEKMRAILIDWLIDVHQKFELSDEALYLTINLIDRFLSVKCVRRRELQLLGISAMLIASKYEEIWPPQVNDLACIADGAYLHEHVLVMEKTILEKLEWTLTVPTPYPFLARFVKASVPDEKMESMVYFLAELGIMHYKTMMFCPSMLAASAVYVARCTLNKTPTWTDTLKFHTGYTEAQVMDCARLLAYFHSKAPEIKLGVVYRKYSNSRRGAVALLPPAQNLLLHGVASV